MKSILIFSLMLAGLTTSAAVSKRSTRPVARSAGVILRGAGSLHGGEAREIVSLLSVKHITSKNKKAERLDFAMGNAGQLPLMGKPGYFNLELRPGKKQIVITFAQALNSRFEERQLRKTLAKSPHVKSAQMFFEPQTQSLNMVLDLKQPMAVRVIPVNGAGHKTARLMVDLFEEKKR
jgi:hypothetical protein